MSQITNTLVMVRPAKFRKNEQTAVNNFFQNSPDMEPEKVWNKAVEEFDAFVTKLEEAGVNIVVLQDTDEPDTPDAVFPNNWISFHENGDIGVYPMFAANRRLERREDIFEVLEAKGFSINNIFDYTDAEEEGIFLEGTGSIILDRVNRKAYCALSPRSDEDLFIEFCEDFEYTPVLFTANQTVAGQRMPIYHTNVMMAIADDFAIVCLQTIDDAKERKAVIKQLKEDGKEIIAITEEQMQQYAGNMLQVQGANGALLVMSATAYRSLTNEQIQKIESYCPILYAELDTIETCGGGSARCMLAEVFLPKL